MDGKVVVVTGGASGIGRASALRLAEEGAAGCVVADVNEESAARVAAEITAATNCAATSFVVDVTNEQDCDRMAGFAMEQYGRIDALVAAAGISSESLERMEERPPSKSKMSVVEGPVHAWRRIIEVNLDGLMLTDRAVAKCMLAAGTPGSIVNITSMCSVWTSAGAAPYAVSKAGALMLTKCLALELAPHGIRVNAVGPGYTETPMTETTRSDETALAGVLGRTPMGRVGQPVEIANTVLFLSSDEASFITGEIVYADGGFNAPSR